MTGYERSPDYGGPPPTWRLWVALAIGGVLLFGFVVWATG